MTMAKLFEVVINKTKDPSSSILMVSDNSLLINQEKHK